MIGDRLKELRVKHGESLQQVADGIGASKAHVWELETGKSSNPSIELLIALARHYGVSVAYLIGENPANNSDDPEIIAIYRELKQLGREDRETIKALINHFKRRKPAP